MQVGFALWVLEVGGGGCYQQRITRPTGAVSTRAVRCRPSVPCRLRPLPRCGCVGEGRRSGGRHGKGIAIGKGAPELPPSPTRPPEGLRSSAPPRSVPSVAFIPGGGGWGGGGGRGFSRAHALHPSQQNRRKRRGKGGKNEAKQNRAKIHRPIYIHPQVALMKMAPRARAERCRALVPTPAALPRSLLPGT